MALASSVARAPGLGPKAIAQVRGAALLHHLGKIAIPDAIRGLGPLRRDEHQRSDVTLPAVRTRAAPVLADRWQGPASSAPERDPINATLVEYHRHCSSVAPAMTMDKDT